MLYPAKFFRLALLGLAIVVTQAPYAQTAEPGGPEVASPEEIEELVIVAHPLSGEGLSQASEVLEGDELSRNLDTSIGDVLGTQPGIHSAQFGKAASRPVIHGLGGPRVRIMEDRIDTLDVSVTSADHAVTVEPFLANRIEVLKGASTLLYGSGAIGGVVDVHTGRIPHELTKFGGGVESRYDNNTSGYATAAKLNGSTGGFAWHLDGAWKDGDDYRIPDFAESAAQRAAEEEEEHEEEEGEEHEEEEEARRRLPGSEFDTESFAAGGSWIGDWGLVGLAVSRLEANYGLPGGHGHEEEHDEEEEEEEHEEEEGNPTLEMEQTRVDLEIAIREPFAGFDSLNIRAGFNDYEHQEIEPSGEVGTDFSNEAWEVRGELMYTFSSWRGAFGLQHTTREFSADGEEAFLSDPVDTDDTGAFWVAETDLANDMQLEVGLRLGRVDHDPETADSESFTTYAGSAGLVIPVGDAHEFGLLLDLSERAPVAEELYSDGEHLVTDSFELGDPNLNEERAQNLAATWRYRSQRWQAVLTAYYTEFSDFIYQQEIPTPAGIDTELPVLQYQQEDATFMGVDLEISHTLIDNGEAQVVVSTMLDYVDAELDIDGNDHVPRIPPLRYGFGLQADWQLVQAGINYMRVTEQDDTAPFELRTGAYEDLRAHVNFRWATESGMLDLFLSGKNLTNDEQRHHTSFIKDVAPAPGRTVEAGLRFSF
ncbi:MAG: TonB-dependent receptor [Pseudomonadota bacterium]